jgi:sensor histidine kinase YesM
MPLRSNTHGKLLDMISASDAAAPPQDSSKMRAFLRHFSGNFTMIAAFNTICAIVVTYVINVKGDFWNNWVFSMCIGSTALFLIDAARFGLWGENKPAKLPMIGITILAVPIAYFVGSYFALKLLGLTTQDVIRDQLNHAAGMLIFITLVSLFITWFFWSRTELLALRAQAEAEKAKSAAVEKQAMQAQLQLLQAQIEPHMLFNTLANLQGLIAIDPPRAQHMLDQLIHYLRATLSSARAEKTTLLHEFDLMRAYLELMSVRMGARLAYSLKLPQELSHQTIPPMLLQPLLENALKHGLEAKIGGGHIDVEAKQQGDELILTVTDTGLGLEATHHPHYQNHGTHIGLANVRERLQALYGDKAEFKISPNAPVGTIAQLTIPLST